ncbi:YwqJ-related putative deaminase [Streptomyces sp. NPDC037389]|uniref:YwqJ-related putative deaminase n=1 Tax=Streptomyces sp. NPDC037389 TaxID=3155369 RepID=UPI0033EFBD26
MSNSYPAVASSLLIQNTIVSQTSLFGEGTPRLHPTVQAFFDALPDDLREPFLGTCAESALISDQFWGLDDRRTDGQVTGLAEARPYFEGSVMLSRKIRPHNHPEHGQPTLPCRSCTALLDALGVRVHQPS